MRIVLLLIFFAVSAGAAHAQVVQFHPFVGYTFPSTLNMSAGDIRFPAAPNVGFNLSLGMGPTGYGIFKNVLFELHYTRFVSEMIYQFDTDNLPEFPIGKVLQHTLMFGCTKETEPKRWAGYGGVYFGVVSMAPQNIYFNTRTRFTFALGGGIKHAFNEKIGLRLDAKAYFPIWKSGYYARWSTISSESGVVTSSLQLIANISMGLYLNLTEIQ
jgi:hypothetical protein